MMAADNKLKICLVCSSGGHLTQIINLQDWWARYQHFWVTFNKEDAISLLNKEKTYYAFYPTNRNLFNLFRNSWLAYKILRKEKPNLVFSTGAGVSVPFFYLAKLFGIKTVFIEVYDRIDSPTLSGRLVYWVADRFLVQWEEQKKFYPRAEYWGQTI